MSILLEQAVIPSGPCPSKISLDNNPDPSGQTILSIQSASKLAPIDCPRESIAVPLTALEHQLELQQLCQNAALYSGDLVNAAAIIAQSAVEILGIDRASLWFYDTDEYFQLFSRYGSDSEAAISRPKLTVSDYRPYFETLAQRDCLIVEHTHLANSITECLAKSNLLLSGAFLEIPVRVQGNLVGAVWYECERPHRWTALEQTSAVSMALLAATAFDSKQRLSLTNTLNHHRRQLQRETIEREQAEQAWQESQRFIQGIVDASTNILYVDSFADGSNFYINRWIQNVLGYSPADIVQLGPRYLEYLVHIEERKLLIAERRRLATIKDGEVVENEYRFRHQQGGWRWLLCRETVFQRDASGQPTQIFGTATDITKRKHAEDTLKAFNQELERLARMDGLTQVANRRSFDEYLTQEWTNVGAGRSALSLILCDIDYFKSFNDTYGHQAGDVCLREVAKAIERSAKRATDLVARYGGEEFAVILPNTDRAGAEQVAQAIQAEVRQLAICHDRSDVSRYVTLSLGISYVTAATDTQLEMLIATADQGLYQAKYKGRNRFCYAEIENL